MATWQQSPHSPTQVLAHRDLDQSALSIAKVMPGCLVFNSTVASLKLARDTFKRGVWDGTLSEGKVAILNSNGERVGRLANMSPRWVANCVDYDNTFDLVVICGALADYTTRKRMADFLNNYDMWRLHVMLVERLPFEPYVVRRIDVGYIFAHKWKDCNPRWETIVLT